MNGAWPAVRMAANLNSLSRGQQSIEQAERAITGDDVTHHVLDPDDVIGLDPLEASTLDTALVALKPLANDGWYLALPVPGQLTPLRGPAPFNTAAVDRGAAVVAAGGRIGLVPYRVGGAVQWRTYAAERPFAPETPYEAERRLSETVLAAAAALTRLDVAGGRRPGEGALMRLAPGYGSRRIAAVDRAARLWSACSAALADEGASITAFEVQARRRELTRVADAARSALVSAISWPD